MANVRSFIRIDVCVFNNRFPFAILFWLQRCVLQLRRNWFAFQSQIDVAIATNFRF
jgi:hypothetical protein